MVAIRDGYIVYVGESHSSALLQFASTPQVIDLGGRTAVPGIIDCHNHIVLMGNRPFQTEIQSFEAVNAQFPINDLRWVVAHVPFITEDYVNRLKAVGGGVNLTPYEYFGTANPAGPPYRMLVDNGLPVGLSSDGMQIAPMNPWIHAYYATTGLNALGKQVNPGQQISRAAVLAHYTRANRWFLGGQDEEVLGTLEIGRLGDVVVLSDDYFSVPDAKLRSLHSELTVLGGTVVHSGGIRYWA